MSLTHRHTLKMNGNCQFQDDCVFFDKIFLSNDWFDMRKTWKSSLVLTFGGIVATKKILNIIWFFILHSLLLIAHLQHTEHSRTLQLLYQSILLMENKSKPKSDIIFSYHMQGQLLFTSHSAYAATETESVIAKIDGLLPPNFL